jgi:class 3 adenylate cyclase
MSVPRKLAAILAADVAGYSRLTGLDEEGTLERLRNLRRELINPAVSLYRGRVVKTTGDGILINFPQSWTPCAVPSMCSAEWMIAIRMSQPRSGSNSGSESTLAM